MNQETLVNVIRASRFQTMNFVAITQLTGGQSETLTTGLPTVTFGPLQTVAQHQFQITNSLSSGATGGFQANPLVSTTFQSAMLSPVSPRTFALLASSHHREPVFYALIESITLSDGDYVVRLSNDPAQADGEFCSLLSRLSTRAQLEKLESGCNYRTFLHFLGILMDSGLTSELLPSAQPGQKDAPQQSIGHICFDRSRAYRGYDGVPACGAQKTKDAKPDKKMSAQPEANRLEIRGLGRFDLVLGFRSPVGVYRFFGSLYGQHGGGNYRYRSGQLQGLLAPNEPFINITSDVVPAGCYSDVHYDGRSYCVPAHSANTALIFTILQELRNLSIQSADLNSAFTVRVSN